MKWIKIIGLGLAISIVSVLILAELENLFGIPAVFFTCSAIVGFSGLYIMLKSLDSLRNKEHEIMEEQFNPNDDPSINDNLEQS
jgi:hypothetical protein